MSNPDEFLIEVPEVPIEYLSTTVTLFRRFWLKNLISSSGELIKRHRQNGATPYGDAIYNYYYSAVTSKITRISMKKYSDVDRMLSELKKVSSLSFLSTHSQIEFAMFCMYVPFLKGLAKQFLYTPPDYLHLEQAYYLLTSTTYSAYLDHIFTFIISSKDRLYVPALVNNIVPPDSTISTLESSLQITV